MLTLARTDYSEGLGLNGIIILNGSLGNSAGECESEFVCRENCTRS
jgi:hypothetical protein